RSVISDGNVAKLSLVGCGLCSDASVGARMLAALTEQGIAVRSMVAAEIKISVLIPLASSQEAWEAVHREFFGQ
ncbi:MAG: aspartate kinase, partial [Clostridia bacterium]|nr:aspartate kinase [Clostridia bacterium]